MTSLFLRVLIGGALLIGLCACTLTGDSAQNGAGGADGVRGQPDGGETGIVTNVIDGDTIDVDINGTEYRIRYIGMNTPERDEPCYADARRVNDSLVSGRTVTLVRDQSDTDRYGRLLRYVYVADLFVNAELVDQGYAEAVLYQPDDRYLSLFQDLERGALAANRGCHPTGIFNDGTDTR